MDAASVADRVKSIIVEQLGVREDQVVTDARFIEDLNADSLDTVELVMKFESEFGLPTIPDDVVENMQTVGKAVEYIEKALAEKGGEA
ncbi:MAG: acyl carrier protein [Lentisphaeria bacterium]|nr:acyl carrier protein [Lentisphaeria bacterium]